MSIKAMTWAFSQPIGGNLKVVLLALADFANDNGDCWPSVETLAEKACVSERTIQRLLLQLAEQQFIATVTRNADNGRQMANRYLLLMDENHEGRVTICRGEGDSSVTGEGDNCVTPLEGTVIRNRQKNMSASDDADPPAPKGDRKYPQAFETFWTAYPRTRIMSKKQAAEAWGKLSQPDRIAAASSLEAFLAYCKKNPDYPVVHACRYLSQKRFEGFGDTPETAAPVPADQWRQRLVFARKNRQWPKKWGALPNEPGCIVPADLIHPNDGLGWAEWKPAATEAA